MLICNNCYLSLEIKRLFVFLFVLYGNALEVQSGSKQFAGLTTASFFEKLILVYAVFCICSILRYTEWAIEGSFE